MARLAAERKARNKKARSSAGDQPGQTARGQILDLYGGVESPKKNKKKKNKKSKYVAEDNLPKRKKENKDKKKEKKKKKKKDR